MIVIVELEKAEKIVKDQKYSSANIIVLCRQDTHLNAASGLFNLLLERKSPAKFVTVEETDFTMYVTLLYVYLVSKYGAENVMNTISVSDISPAKVGNMLKDIDLLFTKESKPAAKRQRKTKPVSQPVSCKQSEIMPLPVVEDQKSPSGTANSDSTDGNILSVVKTCTKKLGTFSDEQYRKMTCIVSKASDEKMGVQFLCQVELNDIYSEDLVRALANAFVKVHKKQKEKE